MTKPKERYFEDYPLGQVMEFGPVDVKTGGNHRIRPEIDPQYFHTHPQKAEHSIFGGLIASGWHTASMVKRLMVEITFLQKPVLVLRGNDELRWLKPVIPETNSRPHDGP
ncbi:MAG: hypothetical protein Ct9H90mP9_1200 [Pseudomonadota bacterium]|nr:MAG: hypothetical protein Ct9H90mP9_1200 [Pseudomonadota bacterium]